MRDLYKKLALPPLINDINRIRASLVNASNADKRVCEHVLLHEGRKQIYDRTHDNLALIGRLRSELELLDTEYWGNSYSDFTPADNQHRQHTTYSEPVYTKPTTPRPQKPASENNYFGNAIVILIVIMVLLVIFSDDNNTSTGYTGNTRGSSNPVMHVTSSALNLRQQPTTKSNIIGKLRRYQDIYKNISKSDGQWSYVQTEDNLKGYVSNKYIAKGSGNTAYLNDCKLKGLSRPYNGQILKQVAQGKHQLVVNNNPGADVLIKLKNSSNKTVITFYVRSGQSARVNVPEGRYRFSYASGTDYSSSCGRFLTNMQASQDPSMTDYIAQYRSGGVAYAVQTYTLKRVSHGNFRPQTINASDF